MGLKDLLLQGPTANNQSLEGKKGPQTANDLFSPGTGKSGYGSRMLFGPEGAIALNNKDTVIAGTKLFEKGDDVISTGAGNIKMDSPLSATDIAAAVVTGVEKVTVQAQSQPSSVFGEMHSLSQVSMGGSIP